VLDIESVLIENGQGSRMVSDEIIRTQEDVQLLEFEDVRPRLDLGEVENDVKIVAPIINLGIWLSLSASSMANG